MRTVTRLGIYGTGLLLVFGGAFAVSAAVVPDSTVAAWVNDATDESDAHGDADSPHPGDTQTAVSGVSISDSGFMLSPVQAPNAVGSVGILSFEIFDETGDQVTTFTPMHGKDLHLIVVRTDGTGYRHAHPELDADSGTWSMPWEWDAAGTYRVYTDFSVGEASSVTLSRTIDIAGAVELDPPMGTSVRDTVNGYDVAITGDFVAGNASDLTVMITRDGSPVTKLEPYLGAFGHLVALREGDLAYLHVHAHGDQPGAGDTAGPDIVFTTVAPTAGRYLLYLDFQVAGQVHTARFVLDAVPSIDTKNDHDGTSDQDHDKHDSD